MAGFRIRYGAHAGLHDAGIGHECGLDFDGREPVTRDVDDVVGASEDPGVAVGIDFRAVASGEPTVFGVGLPVGGVPAFRIAPHGARHGWRELGEHDVALGSGRGWIALVVDDRGCDSWHVASYAAGFNGGCVRPWCEDCGAGF